MLNKDKTDPVLGHKVNDYLTLKGVQTPFASTYNFNNNEKIIEVSGLFEEIMKVLGLDLSNDSLKNTPYRIGEMFINELFYGLDFDNFPKITTVENKMQYDEMILEKNIRIYSNCELTFLPIIGNIDIAYIPNKLIIIPNNIHEIVNYFSSRPQLSERLISQLYHTLTYILNTKDIDITFNISIPFERVYKKIGGSFIN